MHVFIYTYIYIYIYIYIYSCIHAPKTDGRYGHRMRRPFASIRSAMHNTNMEPPSDLCAEHAAGRVSIAPSTSPA